MHQLPYNCDELKEFRLPAEMSPCDVMILCHSTTNRGLSITDVPDSFYDKYLRDCSARFGNGNLLLHSMITIIDHQNKDAAY